MDKQWYLMLGSEEIRIEIMRRKAEEKSFANMKAK